MRFLASLGLAILMTAVYASPTVARCSFRCGGWVSVRGYVTSRGTYVAPHFRTRPDGIPENNLSDRGGAPRPPEPAVVATAGSTSGPLVTIDGPRVIPGPTTWTETGPSPKEAKEPWCASKRVVGTGAGFCISN